jgi:predicted ATPase
MTFFETRMRPGGIYLLDEPEAALSPSRQIEFIKLLLRATEEKQSQIILATHSPLLMPVGGGEVLYFTGQFAEYRHYTTTPHFQTYKDFMPDPEGFMESIAFSL